MAKIFANLEKIVAANDKLPIAKCEYFFLGEKGM